MITDDHQIIIDGIRALLNEEQSFNVVAEASTGKEAIEKLKLLSADVVLMDIDMPVMNGIEATKKIKSEFSDVKRDYYHVDATCMWMVKNPEWFDVIVTGNMFGDIITDLGAMVQGGMGIAAGGNINPEGVSMFEPIGGSAPKYTGKNVINPLASISSVDMMLRHVPVQQQIYVLLLKQATVRHLLKQQELMRI